MVKLKNIMYEALSLNKPEEYRKELIELIGEPSYDTDMEAGWFNPNIPEMYNEYKMLIRDVDKVYVIDEEIKHEFPMPHLDFVYTTYSVPKWQQDKGLHIIDPDLIAEFAGVTGSIIIDPLKGTVTARCGDLVANDKTIQFVLDVVDGKAEATKDECKKRMMA